MTRLRWALAITVAVCLFVVFGFGLSIGWLLGKVATFALP